ncbi:MAG: hypothetical protein ABSA06_08155 [Geobacteraceae bacterium]
MSRFFQIYLRQGLDRSALSPASIILSPKFSLLLALETTNATPIRPAIGIALAAILLFA